MNGLVAAFCNHIKFTSEKEKNMRDGNKMEYKNNKLVIYAKVNLSQTA